MAARVIVICDVASEFICLSLLAFFFSNQDLIKRKYLEFLRFVVCHHHMVACCHVFGINYSDVWFFSNAKTHVKQCLGCFILHHQYDACLKIDVHVFVIIIITCFLTQDSHEERFRGLSCDCA